MSDVAEELLKNKAFLRGVAAELATNKEMKFLILQSMVRDVATKEDFQNLKEDIRDLRRYVDVRINDLKEEIDSLKRYVDVRISDLDKRIDGLDKRISVLQWVMIIFFSIFSIFLSVLTFLVATLPR